MSNTEYELFQEQQRSNWIRLRTLVILRWVAIAGQMAAVFAAVTILDLQFEVGLTVVAIGASVVANLFFTSLYPENRRLSEPEATMMLVFDILQLGVLLFLTGGLYNPFALLLLGPVTIAATVLHLRSTFLLGVMSIGLITVLAQWNLPLIDADGVALALPRLFLFGFWIALVTGVVFLSIYARQVTSEMNLMSDALVATKLALAREQKLTDLGGVIAAAAHEFGTPLATIKLVASELVEELHDHPDLRDDALLIREQADRCRDILRSMGRAGKEDLHLRHAPVEAVVREAAEPHTARGKTVNFKVRPTGALDLRQPTILRRPEMIHGLRNLIQNAVDFASDSVEIECTWTDTTIIVRITDDGRGFPQSVIGRIGDPFVRRRSGFEDRVARPGYDGMGLGLFIAKTLLERSGAKLTFANGGRDGPEGAIVVVEWPRSKVEPQPMGALGENQPFEV